MLRRPNLTDARGKRHPIAPHSTVAARRHRLIPAGYDLACLRGPKRYARLVYPAIALLAIGTWWLTLWLCVWLKVPPLAWILMTLATPLAAGVLSVQWTRRLSAGAIAATYTEAGYCASCGYDLLTIPPDPDHLRTCPECGATWRLPSSPASGEEMVIAKR